MIFMRLRRRRVTGTGWMHDFHASAHDAGARSNRTEPLSHLRLDLAPVEETPLPHGRLRALEDHLGHAVDREERRRERVAGLRDADALVDRLRPRRRQGKAPEVAPV